MCQSLCYNRRTAYIIQGSWLQAVADWGDVAIDNSFQYLGGLEGHCQLLVTRTRRSRARRSATAEGAKKKTSKVEGNNLCKISYVAISRRLRSHVIIIAWALSLYGLSLSRVSYIPFCDYPLRILYSTTTLTNVDMHTRIWKSSNRKGTLISQLSYS